MVRNILWALFLTAAVIAAPAARADYEAGQRAWDAGRPDLALTEWRSAAADGDRRAMLALGRLFVKGWALPRTTWKPTCGSTWRPAGARRPR